MDASILRKDYCSKLMKLSEIDLSDLQKSMEDIKIKETLEDQMEIDGEDKDNQNSKYDWIREINEEIRTLQASTLLIPIREIVLLGDYSISQKVCIVII